MTDEAGKPIAGALVRTKFLNDIREAKTGNDGVYRLAGCEPRAVRIVVSAKGRATDMKELNIEPEMGPVDFQMKPGGTVRIRVLDEQGKPGSQGSHLLPAVARQFPYFEFDHVSQYADENGVWVWNEAPLDEFKADICPPDGMQLELQPLIARAEEYVFRTSPALCRVGQGRRRGHKRADQEVSSRPGISIRLTRRCTGARNENYVASDGQYRIRRTAADFDLIRIEADGYQPASSRDIKSNEGTCRSISS